MVAICFGFGAVAAEGWAGGGCEESRHICISSYEFRRGEGKKLSTIHRGWNVGKFSCFVAFRPSYSQRVNFDI